MNLPEFLLGDNTDCEDAIFVIHTQYPRFIIDLTDEDVEWLDDVSHEDPAELAAVSERLFLAAAEIYDREIEGIENRI